MPNQLSPEIRKKLLDRVLFQKISVAKACRESRISRYTFYKWLKRQQGGKDLKDKKRQVKHYWRQPSEEIIKIIKRIILAHPDWSKYKIHSALPKDEKGKIILGVHGVYNILRHLSLSSSKERQAFKEASLTNKFRSLSSQKRLFIIDRVKKASIPVAKVCIESLPSGNGCPVEIVSDYRRASIGGGRAPRKGNVVRASHCCPALRGGGCSPTEFCELYVEGAGCSGHVFEDDVVNSSYFRICLIG